MLNSPKQHPSLYQLYCVLLFPSTTNVLFKPTVSFLRLKFSLSVIWDLHQDINSIFKTKSNDIFPNLSKFCISLLHSTGISKFDGFLENVLTSIKICCNDDILYQRCMIVNVHLPTGWQIGTNYIYYGLCRIQRSTVLHVLYFYFMFCFIAWQGQQQSLTILIN